MCSCLPQYVTTVSICLSLKAAPRQDVNESITPPPPGKVCGQTRHLVNSNDRPLCISKPHPLESLALSLLLLHAVRHLEAKLTVAVLPAQVPRGSQRRRATPRSSDTAGERLDGVGRRCPGPGSGSGPCGAPRRPNRPPGPPAPT